MRRRMTGRVRWLVLVLAVLALWAVAAAAVLLQARSNLVAGRADIRSARHRHVDELLQGPAASDLARARTRFTKARRELASPVFFPLRVVPLLGRQVRAAHTIANAGVQTSAAASVAIRDAKAALDAPHGPGPDRIALVRRLGAIADTTQRALGHIDVGQGGLLLPPVASARNELRTELVQVRTGLARGSFAASAVADLLTGPRRYMLFAANNAEMRAGSGAFLSVGELDTGDGRVQLSHMTTVVDVPVPPGAVPLTGDLAGRWGWLQPNVDWRNLMLSPRFDANAALAAQMWQASGHPPADGVMALDPVALQALLRGIGPVTVNGRTVGADDVVTELLHDQYTRFPQLEERPERREELSVFASAAMQMLDTGSWSPSKLGDQLAAAARGRHVMMWSANTKEEQAWLDAGIGGIVGPNSVMAAVLNRGGNKLDQYVATNADLRLRPSGDHTDATLTLTLKNNAPLNEIQYIIGPHFGTGLNPGDYLGIVAFTLPEKASAANVDGVNSIAVAGPDGPTRVIGGEILVPAGQSHTVVVHYRLPGTSGQLQIEPSARVPAMQWRIGNTTWQDAERRTINW